MFTKIVVGFDGSDSAERALRLACDISKKYKSEVHLVHTPQPQTVAFAMGAMAGYAAVTTMPPPEDVKAANDKMIGMAHTISQDCGVTLAQTHLKQGDPGDVMVAYADKCGADLIVMGRRGLGALGAIVQGSTSLRVNHLSKCATLSVI
jgi:nucleotide-binding universal stress UspA family protein